MSEQATEYYKAYEEHAKTLRTWLVAYGIGAPVLFMTNERLSGAISHNAAAPWIAGFFLGGVGLQVALATTNKVVNWAAYFALQNPAKCEGRRFKIAIWMSEQFWIDFIVDLAAMIVFGFATWWALQLVLFYS